jgi:hypothetical protein
MEDLENIKSSMKKDDAILSFPFPPFRVRASAENDAEF